MKKNLLLCIGLMMYLSVFSQANVKGDVQEDLSNLTVYIAGAVYSYVMNESASTKQPINNDSKNRSLYNRDIYVIDISGRYPT